MAKQTRGIRNNNPGNLDFNPKVEWRGQVGLERGVSNPRFVEFQNPMFGIRALVKVLLTYHRKHKLRTIRQMISRWAPGTENNTQAYIDAVSSACAIQPDAPFPIGDAKSLAKLAQAIIVHENGQDPYGYTLILSVVSAVMSETT